MSTRLTVKTAAELVAQSYRPSGDRIGEYRIIATNPAPAEAYLLSGDILVIPGSNSIYDYINFNFRPFGLGRKKLTVKGYMGKASDWHQGFLAHANSVERFLNRTGRAPRLIVGHSLGAASAQVLSKSLLVPAIGFAAPRVCKKSPSPGQINRCLLVNRFDDIVPDIPDSFEHQGWARIMRKEWHFGHRHKMKHYIAMLPKQIGKGAVPESWPR